MYVLLVAADVHGTKKNIELAFTMLPAMDELHKKIGDAFTVERKMSRATGHRVEPFIVRKLNIYDEVKGRWVHFVSPTQLYEWAQLYVEADHGAPDMSSVPSAVKLSSRLPKDPTAWSSSGLPSIPKWVTSKGEDAKAKTIFEEFDAARKSFITHDDFLRVFNMNDMGLGSAVIYDLFHGADHDKDGVISWEEFVPFYEEHPKLMGSLYYRTRSYWNDMQSRKESNEVAELLDYHRTKEDQARQALQRAQQEITVLEDYVANQRAASQSRTYVEHEQEKILIERQARLSQMHRNLDTQEHILERQRTDFVKTHNRPPGSPSPARVF